jgi:hypothetical protein
MQKKPVSECQGAVSIIHVHPGTDRKDVRCGSCLNEYPNVEQLQAAHAYRRLDAAMAKSRDTRVSLW